ncbi:MAG: GNAT family N-acetyltransferase [Chitinophagales bacterium]|jgi:ribosomal-protein-serine acetyltransferase|nr:GNAT family N-acetyltransferase [Chitinophagales bacterium]
MKTTVITSRLELEAVNLSHSQALLDIINEQHEYLGEFLPWAKSYPKPLEFQEAFCKKAEKDRLNQTDFHFVIKSSQNQEIIGLIGAHKRLFPYQIEIGYWLSQTAQGHGYMTEATKSLTEACLEMQDIREVIIGHAVNNQKSGNIPVRLGFDFLEENKIPSDRLTKLNAMSGAHKFWVKRK